MNIELEENERIDDLEYNGLKIIQNKKRFLFWNRQCTFNRFFKRNKTWF